MAPLLTLLLSGCDPDFTWPPLDPAAAPPLVPLVAGQRIDLGAQCDRRRFTGEPRVNEQAQVAVEEFASDGTRHAVLLTPWLQEGVATYCLAGSTTDISQLWTEQRGEPGRRTTPTALNESGNVAGSAILKSGFEHAFFFGRTRAGGQVIDLSEARPGPHLRWNFMDGPYLYAGMESTSVSDSYAYALGPDNVVLGSAAGLLCTLGSCENRGFYGVAWQMEYNEVADRWSVQEVKLLTPYLARDPHLDPGGGYDDRPLHKGMGTDALIVGRDQHLEVVPSILYPSTVRRALPTGQTPPQGEAIASVPDGERRWRVIGHFAGAGGVRRGAVWTVEVPMIGPGRITYAELPMRDPLANHVVRGASSDTSTLVGGDALHGVLWQRWQQGYVCRHLPAMTEATSVSSGGRVVTGTDLQGRVHVAIGPFPLTADPGGLPCTAPIF